MSLSCFLSDQKIYLLKVYYASSILLQILVELYLNECHYMFVYYNCEWCDWAAVVVVVNKQVICCVNL